jgi:hypothetical protein
MRQTYSNLRSLSRFSSLLHQAVAVGTALSAALAIACGSDSKPSPAQPNNSNPDDDAGACPSTTAISPSPSLNGHFALKTVASRFVPATGLTTEFYTRTTSILVTSITQTDTQISLSAEYCDQTNDDPGSPAHVVIPDAYKRSLVPFVRTGTYGDNGSGTDVLELPTFVEVQGATLSDPAHDALPTDPSDPRVTDQDGDGNPGVTIKLQGIVSGDLYVVQRQMSELTGIAVAQDRLEGHYGFTSEQNVLAANPAELKTLAAQTAIVDPNACASRFVFVNVTETATCTDVLANSTLFD